MSWKLQPDRPIYLQLMDMISFRIIAGTYKSGEKIPSVRDLAQEASVNPNTMQKALSSLEESGLIFSHRTSGRFVTENSALIEEAKERMAKEFTSEFLLKMKELGVGKTETLSLLEQIN